MSDGTPELLRRDVRGKLMAERTRRLQRSQAQAVRVLARLAHKRRVAEMLELGAELERKALLRAARRSFVAALVHLRRALERLLGVDQPAAIAVAEQVALAVEGASGEVSAPRRKKANGVPARGVRDSERGVPS